MSLRFATGCSGIGAPEVALKRIGWHPVFCAEIEKFPSAVLKHHYPNIPNYGDITKFKEWPAAAIDVLILGTPCQAFSIAGLRKGIADPRGNLALTALAIVDRYHPTWFLWENVPGVYSSWSDESCNTAGKELRETEFTARQLAKVVGFDAITAEQFGEFEEVTQTSDLDCFISGLEELGYGTAVGLLDAQYRGLAQRRERVFVVGHIGGHWQRSATVLFDFESMSWNSPPSREKGQRVADTVAGGARKCGGYSNDDIPSIEVAKACRSSDGGISRADADTIIPVQELNKRQSGNPMNGVGHGQPGDPMFTLQSSAEHGVCAPITGRPYADTEGREDSLIPEIAPPLLAQGNQTGGDRPPGTNVDTAESLIPEVAWALQARDAKGADTEIKDGHLLAFHSKGDGEQCDDNLSPTLRACPHSQSHPNAGAPPAICFDTTQITSKTNRCNPQPGDPSHPLAKDQHAPAIAFRAAGQDGFTPSEVSPPIASTDGGGAGAPTVQAAYAVRRLTPRECERLQGFPDDYTLIPWRKRPAAECPDGPRYKALGNSMATNVIELIGRRIQMVHEMK